MPMSGLWVTAAQVSAGDQVLLVLLRNGTVLAYGGDNSTGQLAVREHMQR